MDDMRVVICKGGEGKFSLRNFSGGRIQRKVVHRQMVSDRTALLARWLVAAASAGAAAARRLVRRRAALLGPSHVESEGDPGGAGRGSDQRREDRRPR